MSKLAKSAGGDGGALRLDRRLLRRACGRAARHYEAGAVLQKTVLAHCLQRLDLVRLTPRVVVDLGSGPGLAGRLLRKRYREARVYSIDFALDMVRSAQRRWWWWPRRDGICADAQALPLVDGSVDLVFSNLCLYLCEAPGLALREAWRALRPGGLFMFTSLGPDTLCELRAAWQGVDDHTHVIEFADMHDVGDALGRAGFENAVLDVERFCLTYTDLDGLLNDLRRGGVPNLTAGRRRGLTGRRAWAALRAAYEGLRVDGRLPATAEVVYAHAWKPLVTTQAPTDGARPLFFHPPRARR
ncbi:MAG: malonyl-ACP O-methyltransferase BioC [Immundisolibacter sp.]